MSSIISNPEQFKALNKNTSDSPFVMLNLLKFRVPDGKNLYKQYVKESAPYVQGVGAEVIFLGKPVEMLNGVEDWDALMLVKYPSRKAFEKMSNNPDYIKIHDFREKALERAVLYSVDEMGLKEILR